MYKGSRIMLYVGTAVIGVIAVITGISFLFFANIIAADTAFGLVSSMSFVVGVILGIMLATVAKNDR